MAGRGPAVHVSPLTALGHGAPANPSPSRKRPPELLRRIVVAVVAAPFVLAAVWLGGIALAALVALGAAGALYEFWAMMAARGRRPLLVGGCVAAALLVAGPALGQDAILTSLALSSLVVLGSVEALARRATPVQVEDVSVTMLGVLAIVWPATFALRLRSIPDHGLAWLALALLAAWAYDTGAYASGRLLGRRPFMAHVSPSKTWEGVLGGLLCAGIAGGSIAAISAVMPWPLGAAVGLLLGCATQAGDLIESWYKRQAGVKDSGRLLPGHGGVLDRIDGLLFSLLVTYTCGMVISGLHIASVP